MILKNRPTANDEKAMSCGTGYHNVASKCGSRGGNVAVVGPTSERAHEALAAFEKARQGLGDADKQTAFVSLPVQVGNETKTLFVGVDKTGGIKGPVNCPVCGKFMAKEDGKFVCRQPHKKAQKENLANLGFNVDEDGRVSATPDSLGQKLFGGEVPDVSLVVQGFEDKEGVETLQHWRAALERAAATANATQGCDMFRAASRLAKVNLRDSDLGNLTNA